MTDYSLLIALWPSLTGTTAQKLAAVNAMTEPGPNVDVQTSSVFAYLALVGKLAKLKAYAEAPPNGANATAVMAAQQLMTLPAVGVMTIEMSRPNVYAVVSAWLGSFVADTANTSITSDDVSMMLSLATPTVPWWQANSYTSPISQNDLDAAGGLT